MTTVSFKDVHLGELRGAQVHLERGLHVFLGDRSDGAADLIYALAGAERPRRGKVTVDGVTPGTSPAVRRSIASLLADEPVLGAAPAVSIATQALGFAGEKSTGEHALALVGAEDIASKSHALLSPPERRRVALGIALARVSAKVLALHEPLWACSALVADSVLTALRQAAEERLVVVATADTVLASRFRGTLHLLRRGVVLGTATSLREFASDSQEGVEISVQTTTPAHACALLSQSEAVSAALFDERSGEVSLRGRSLEALCQAVTQVFQQHRLELHALTVKVPVLHDLQRQFRTGVSGASSAREPAAKLVTNA